LAKRSKYGKLYNNVPYGAKSGGNMRKTTIITAIILAACIFSAGCQRRYDGMTIRPGVLMVGIDISYPPMEYFAPDA